MNQVAQIEHVLDDELNKHHCPEHADNVSGDPETTAFKRRARLQQALWREEKKLPIGTNPKRPKEELGNRIASDVARESKANFLDESVREAVRFRIENREDFQMIDEDRLYCNLLSSMPMCFNLFGSLHGNLAIADQAVHRWWPDVTGEVSAVRFEWSPGRRKTGEYLENRSAFDVAFEFKSENGRSGVIGIETKYHEDCKHEKINLRKRYEEVSNTSGVFKAGAVSKLLETDRDLQQIWLDHLLALSMLQHGSQQWHWVKFVLVHPARNPSYARVAERYIALLSDPTTFEVRTIESLLDAQALPAAKVAAFRDRYFL